MSRPAETPLPAAQDWEDETPEITGTGPAGEGALGFSGTGDTAFARVIADPDARVVLRGSAAEAALVHLKLAAVRGLPVQSVRSFFGIGHFGRRVWFYHEVRPLLPGPARAFWDARESMVRAGILGQGAAEQAMSRFRSRVLPLCHSAATVDALFRQSSIEEQLEWAKERWFTRRWAAAVRLHPVATTVDRALRTTLASGDFRLQWRLLGRYLDLERGPAWLTAAGHGALRAGIHRVSVNQ